MIRLKTTNNLTFIFTFLVFFLFVNPLSVRSEQYVVSSDSLYNYAKSAFDEKDYKRAADEFKRFRFYFPKDDRNSSAGYMISLSYLLSGDFNNCIKSAKELIETELRKENGISSGDSVIFKTIMVLVKCYELQGKIQLAANELRNMLMLTDDNDLRDLIYYNSALLFFSHGQFLNANSALEKIGSTSKLKENSEILRTSVTKSVDIPEKSPFIAGFLSIVPGCGYFYTGRYRDGFVSLIFNGLLIYAAAESFDSGNEGLGALIAFVETGFYLGNIYGSYNSAVKYNNYNKRKFIEEEKNLIKISIIPDPSNNRFLVSSKFQF